MHPVLYMCFIAPIKEALCNMASDSASTPQDGLKWEIFEHVTYDQMDRIYDWLSTEVDL